MVLQNGDDGHSGFLPEIAAAGTKARIKFRYWLELAMMIAALTGRPGLAQTLAPNVTPVTPACELHIWPAAITHSSYMGWFHGGVVDGYKLGFKGYPNMYADALDTQRQVTLLNQVDWRAQMSDPALVVVIHQAPTGSDDDRTRTTRVIATASPCYREVIIKATIVEASTFSSRTVRLVTVRKRFDGATALPVNFTATSEGAIILPEPSAADFDNKMRTAVQNAYLTAVRRFLVTQLFH